MEEESPSSSPAGSRWGNVLYAVFAILALILAVMADLAMVLTFGK